MVLTTNGKVPAAVKMPAFAVEVIDSVVAPFTVNAMLFRVTAEVTSKLAPVMTTVKL